VLYVGIPVPEAPEGRQAYKYNVIDTDTYELCADFTHPSAQNGNITRPTSSPIESEKNPYNNWDHGVGETCFERTVVDYSKVR
jgi:hypothetical protein